MSSPPHDNGSDEVFRPKSQLPRTPMPLRSLKRSSTHSRSSSGLTFRSSPLASTTSVDVWEDAGSEIDDASADMNQEDSLRSIASGERAKEFLERTKRQTGLSQRIPSQRRDYVQENKARREKLNSLQAARVRANENLMSVDPDDDESPSDIPARRPARQEQLRSSVSPLAASIVSSDSYSWEVPETQTTPLSAAKPSENEATPGKVASSEKGDLSPPLSPASVSSFSTVAQIFAQEPSLPKPTTIRVYRDEEPMTAESLNRFYNIIRLTDAVALTCVSILGGSVIIGIVVVDKSICSNLTATIIFSSCLCVGICFLVYVYNKMPGNNLQDAAFELGKAVGSVARRAKDGFLEGYGD